MNSHSIFPYTTESKKELFKYICDLAREGNVAKLNELVDSGVYINFTIGLQRPVSVLAAEKNVLAVDMLIEKFGASRSHAVFGYAIVGLVEQVNEQFLLGAKRSFAAQGYALGGYTGEVNKLLADDDEFKLPVIFGYAAKNNIELVNSLLQSDVARYSTLKTEALKGYAYGGNAEQISQLSVRDRNDIQHILLGHAHAGNVEMIEQLIATGDWIDEAAMFYALTGNVDRVNAVISKGAKLEFVVGGYARGGHVNEVNAVLTTSDKVIYKNRAIYGYASWGYIDQVNKLVETDDEVNIALRGHEGSDLRKNVYKGTIARLALFDNVELRKKLIFNAKCPNESGMRYAMIETLTTKINRVMHAYGLNAEQAKGLFVIGARVWFLQGVQLVKAGIIPAEIFIHIATFMLNKKHKDAVKIYEAVHKQLFVDRSKHAINKFTLGLFNFNQYSKKHDELKERYVSRVNF